MDLLEGGFDLGFRASSQTFDSGYVGKPLKAFNYHVCASPEYLKNHPPITTIEDLLQHNCFEYSYFKSGRDWPVANGIRIKGNLTANNTLMIRDAVEAGLGIALLPGFVARPGLESGRLTELLTSSPKPNLTLYALYPNRKYLPPALSKFIEFIDKWFNREMHQG